MSTNGDQSASPTAREYGAILTATEIEGCSPAADWSRWIARGHAPDSQRGSSLAGFTDSWTEDLEQLAGLGISALAVTLEWADLEPQQGRHDAPAIEFRRDLLAAVRDLGMSVWVCLVDGTLPGWFAEDEGGFNDDRARGLLWPRHIDWIGETFGDLADGWIPQREPLHWALRRHLLGVAPPGQRDVAKAALAVQSAMLAEGEAWRLLQGSAPVATYQTARQIYAETDDVKAKPLAAGLERLLWHPWVSAIAEGQLVVGDLPSKRVDHLRDAFDRIIVELRPSIRIDGSGRWHHHPADQAPGPAGLTMWPDAQAEAANRVVGELGEKPIFAAGNLGDVTDDGRARSDHVQAMMAMVEDQSLAGWWQSSPIDGYHFEHGFGIQPGLIRADRAETPAAGKFREVAG
ncbi:MAG: family 1 glycosylhydrolase [Acidimicrobiales bacterium]